MRKGAKMPRGMSLIEFSDKYNSEGACRSDMWERRLRFEFECPECHGTADYKMERAFRWECAKCKRQVKLSAGTVFDNTEIGLRKWYFAAFLPVSSKGGISAKELQSQIGVTYKSAWYVNRRLREAMETANNKYKPDGIVPNLQKSCPNNVRKYRERYRFKKQTNYLKELI